MKQATRLIYLASILLSAPMNTFGWVTHVGTDLTTKSQGGPRMAPPKRWISTETMPTAPMDILAWLLPVVWVVWLLLQILPTGRWRIYHHLVDLMVRIPRSVLTPRWTVFSGIAVSVPNTTANPAYIYPATPADGGEFNLATFTLSESKTFRIAVLGDIRADGAHVWATPAYRVTGPGGADSGLISVEKNGCGGDWLIFELSGVTGDVFTISGVSSNGEVDLTRVGFDSVSATVIAFAGADKTYNPSVAPVTIGGSPTAVAGTPGYTYSWSPTTGLSDPNIANPTASPKETTTYTLTVTDSTSPTPTTHRPG